MAKKARTLVDDLRGASRLAVQATRGVTDLVEAMHQTIAGGPDVCGRPLAGVARAFTAPVYESIRSVTELVGAGIDRALAELAALLGPGMAGPEREALLAAVNGVLGDYLEATSNPLAIEMSLRKNGQVLSLERKALRDAFPNATGKLLVLVHGSCMTDGQWLRRGHDHGAALARDLDYTPVYLHYNSGLHVSQNGRAFAALLAALVDAWPVPVEEIVLLSHSMGGLVSRSACHSAEIDDLGWRKKLRAIVFLGTPHHGSPLERQGNWVDALLGVSRYSAPLARLGQIRSAGVTDLRFGNVLDEHWQGRDRFAKAPDSRARLTLPDGVACYAVAATTATEPLEPLPGDGLVPIESALGRHAKPALTLDIPLDRQWIAFGTPHMDLLSSPVVYSKLREWLEKPRRGMEV
jgi:triacylglycerol esterase/lipase EstA (alpha/beta hydrolase family)